MGKGARAVAVAVVVAATVGVVAAVEVGRDETVATGAPPVSSPSAPPPPGWSRVTDLTLSTSDLWFAAPAGPDEVVLVGGPVYSHEGPASYVSEVTLVSLGSGRVTTLRPPPVRHPLGFASGLVHGGEVFVVGRSCDYLDESVATCRPGHHELWSAGLRGTWQRRDVPDAAEGGVGSPGLRLIGSPAPGRLVALLDRPDRHFAYDVESGAWQELPRPPVPPRAACAGDGRTVVLDYADVHSGPTSVTDPGGLPAPRLASYEHATDRWEELPAPPVESSTVMYVRCAGRHVLVAANGGGLLTVASFDTRRRVWTSSQAPVDAPFVVDDRTVAWTGSELVAWDPFTSAGAAFDPGAGSWRRIPSGGPPSQATVVLPSGGLVVVGSSGPDLRRPTVHRYEPPTAGGG